MKFEQIHLVVTGRVQGVGFRYSTADEARRLGVTGWVRNMPDGSVEILAESDTNTLGTFLMWCQTGPSQSHVESATILERKALPATTFKVFEIIR